jgi:hypothetical protein
VKTVPPFAIDEAVWFANEQTVFGKSNFGYGTHEYAIHLHLEVLLFHWNPTVRGEVVEPLEVVGAVMLEFSVFVQVIV